MHEVFKCDTRMLVTEKRLNKAFWHDYINGYQSNYISSIALVEGTFISISSKKHSFLYILA
uniref:Uncharacterized protein n=1 Tax=Romanomermis culicivorax TaxID=13658 RepID=A0A915HLN7_ROMCU